MADAVIGIRIDPTGAVTGARTVRRSMDDITGSSRAATSAVNMLRAAMMSLGAAISVRQLADMADTWSTIQWRVRNATSSLQEAERTMRRITEVARRTWSSLDQTAEAFLRQEASMKALGYTTRQQLDHIEALNSALLISGLRGQRAEQVAAAWARAMARGTLRGDEFNSVAENSSRLMQALADHLGVSVVELRALAEQGKLTSAAMYGITDSLTELRAEMEGDATLKGALVVLRNEMTRVVGEMDGAARASSSLGNMIVALADNMDVVAAIAGGVAVSAVLALTAAINTATIATRAWSAALAITPLGMIALAIGTVTTALIYYRDQTVEVGDVSIRVGNVLHAIWTTVSQPVAALVNWVGSLLLALGQLATFDFSGSWETFRQSGQAWVDAGNNIIEAWRNLTAEGEQAETVSDAVAEALGNAGSVAGDAAKKFADVVAALSQQNERALLMVRAMDEGGAAVNRLNLEFEVYDNLLRAGVIPKTASLREALSLSTSMANDNARAIGDLTHSYWHYQQQIESMQRIQDLDDQLELAQAELRLVGETADVRAEALAVLEAEIRLKRMGVDLSSRLAQEELKRVRALSRTRQAISQNTAEMEEQRRLGKQLADDTTRYAADLFADLFRDTGSGWRGMWQNMRDTMISMLARMAAEAALRPIVVSVLGAMGVAGAGAAAGAAGIGGAGGGGMFGLGNLSDLSSIFNASGGSMMPGVDAWAQANLGFGSIGEMARPSPGFIGPMPAQTAGLLNGGSAMAGFASLGNVLGIAGSALPGLMSGNYAQAGFGAAGAAIGTALLPGIGTAIGGFLGNAVGSLFGGGGNTDQQIRPYSHARGTGRGVQTPFREFRNSAHRFDGSALEQAVVQADHAIAAALSDRAIEQVRDYFDLAGTIKGKKRDNKELGPKHFSRFIRDSMDDVILALGGQAAAAGYRSAVSGASPEQALEMAQKFAIFLGGLADETLFKPQEISEIEQAWKALGAQADEFRGMAEQLGQSIAEVERQFEEAQQAFRDDFNTSIARAISDLTGGTMAMEQAFRDLQKQQKQRLEDAELIGADIVEVERLNLLERLALLEQFGLAAGDFATETERASFGIARYGQGMAQFAVNLGQASQRAAGQYRSLITSLQDSLDDLLIGPLSNLNFFEQQRIAEQKFNELAAAALEGSTEAMGKLPEAGRRFLELTAQLYGNAGTSYDAAIKHVIAVQEEAQRAAEQHAREQEQIADHAAQMAQVYQEAMQAVAMAISDGVITPDEVRDIERKFGAVTDAAQMMGPAGEMFAMELANVAKMIEDGLLTDNEIAVLMDNVALFNATLVDGLLTGGEIAAIRIRQDLINDVIRKGTISDEALEVLQAQARAVAVTIQHAVTDEALDTLRDHARTAADILRHDTIPRAVIDHLVTQADLIAGTIRGGVFNEATRKVLADRLADLRVLWRDGAPKPNDIKAIRAQVDLARAALVDGVVTSKEVKAIKDQVAMVRNAYKDGVITNSEIKLIQTGTNKLIKEIERIPNAVEHIAARVGDSLALLRGVADQHAAHQRQQAIGQFAAGVGSSAGALVGTNISTPTRRSYNQHRYGKLYDSSSATLNLNTGGLSNWHHSNDQRYNQDWVREWQPVLFGLAQQLQDLVGGTLPSVYIQGHSYGTPTLRVRVGDGNMMEFTNNQLRVPYVGGHFLRQLAFRITGLDSGVAQILRQVDFRPPKDGAQGGLEKLARLLAEAGHVPGFASGGIHAGGWRIVGEQGPELEYTGPSRIYSAPDTNRILASNDNSEVVKELRTLVQQQGRMIEVISAQAAADRADNAALREELAALKRETRQQGRRPNGRAA